MTMLLLIGGCALVALSLLSVSVQLVLSLRPLVRYPEDRHLLPRMESNYICFPDWMMRRDWSFRIAIWIGERFNGGRYCFTVDRNKHGQGWPTV
jgi:hypothetical protein